MINGDMWLKSINKKENKNISRVIKKIYPYIFFENSVSNLIID